MKTTKNLLGILMLAVTLLTACGEDPAELLGDNGGGDGDGTEERTGCPYEYMVKHGDDQWYLGSHYMCDNGTDQIQFRFHKDGSDRIDGHYYSRARSWGDDCQLTVGNINGTTYGTMSNLVLDSQDRLYTFEKDDVPTSYFTCWEVVN